ncbi:MAG: pyrroline-5-carboxylate reductase [Caldilineaceae bacterium]|nr:pyrroline-5-carboxylate reductase [Caldilineaceae bacterium]HRJ44997.1 pyrroline-5-carboxylate reductase [Caldilineaceae bacterium]
MQLSGKIAFIGGGAMAEAILKRLLLAGLVQPEQITVAEPVPGRREFLASAYGVQVDAVNRSAASGAAILVLAVKPQVLDKVLPDLAGVLQPETLVISIMAGVRISSLHRGLGHERLVRSMPNTPAQVGKGMTVWTATPAVTSEDKGQAQMILEAMGDAFFVDDEHAIDLATGLSGSGPGFVFLLVEGLIDAGVHIGFSRAQAERMVLQTVEGSIALLRESGAHPADLRNRVTSPGGTTAAGSLVLEQRAVRAALIEAVAAASARSAELGDLSEGA